MYIMYLVRDYSINYYQFKYQYAIFKREIYSASGIDQKNGQENREKRYVV